MDRRNVSARSPLVSLLGLLILSAVCGCAAIRVVRETPDGGVLALPANTNCWPMYYRDRAEKLMSEKCPGGYRIDREEFVWNGKEGPEGHRYYNSYFGYTDPNDEFGPYLRKEYRITFHAAPPASRPSPHAPEGAGRRPPAEPASPAQDENKDELPPPRRLPPRAGGS